MRYKVALMADPKTAAKAGTRYPVTIRFRTTRENARLLEKVAKEYRRSPSDVLRLLVEEAAGRIPKHEGHAVAAP